ncbi:MAG: D-glycero-beta-D-manno-heptose 1-phosphate adenylyltransferase [Bacteroidetes bacterium]|nr:D-glycero-beta-D-manno-heptose 1-phosphate adenylyltransferase [Bacteroidota bacterium]
MGKVFSIAELTAQRQRWKEEKKTVVFTNGVFDLLHRGHVKYLAEAKKLGDVLIVGMNTDDSVHRIKGPLRPIVPGDDRAFVLSQLASVDAVCLFTEETPFNLIAAVVPDILVKGGDYTLDAIVGKDIVEHAGGKVMTIPFVENKSTTNIVEIIRQRFCS